ncbi:MAG: uroporphyrinogen decarboxylase family protein, partial [Spirochaetia bacterium]
MQNLSSKKRLIAAIEGKTPDRLPVTTHHVMPYFLNKYMNGISNDEFFDHFGMDRIVWPFPLKADEGRGEYPDPDQGPAGFLEGKRIFSDNWRIRYEELSDPVYKTTRATIVTPKGNLSAVIQSNEYTTWVSEHLIKEKKDIDLVAEFGTHPVCDVEELNRIADHYGETALIRAFIPPFDIFGQPGCWQDAACMMGIEKLIMTSFDDPEWVHEFLKILLERKRVYIRSLKGAKYDILELGGGDASTTVISPDIFDRFVAPYDAELIREAHDAGQRIVYHTCGGMMPILENIAAMNPDAMETFTPSGMGGDADLEEAKRRIGGKVCMIGGFDQFHFFKDVEPEAVRSEVRRCFEAAGRDGGYIISPSDHFFDADLECI